MARFSIKYTDKQDRLNKIKEQELLKRTMVSDTFDKSWKPNDEPFGTMVFTDWLDEDTPEPRELRRDFKKEFSTSVTINDKLNIVAEALGLK